MRTGSETMDLTVELFIRPRREGAAVVSDDRLQSVSIRPMLASALSRVRRAPRERPR
jgi:hypothetical protein